MKRTFWVISLILIYISNCYGWGQKGHDVIAYIAECRLTKQTLSVLDSILDNKSIVYYSNWLDNASHTPEYAFTKTWHYKNIDATETYEEAYEEPKGNIVRALQEYIYKLSLKNITKEESAFAVKLIIHLMGDLHQPMHMGRLSDLGGNKHKVIYFNKDNNLHSVWDSSIVESGHKWSYTEWSNQLDRNLTDEEINQYVQGDINSWGKATYLIAQTIYDSTPQYHKISYDYIAKWTPVIETQFLKGGLRLADILNTLFDDNYKPINSEINR